LAALVIAFASWPLYQRLRDAVGGSRTVAATLALAFIITFLVVPIVLAGTYTVNEVREWFSWAVETNRNGAPTPEWMTALPAVGEWLDQQWVRYIGHPGAIGELIQIVSGANIGSIYRGVLAAGGGAFNLLLTLL